MIEQLRSVWIRQIGNDFNYTTYKFCSLKDKLDFDAFGNDGIFTGANTNKKKFKEWLNCNVPTKLYFVHTSHHPLWESFYHLSIKLISLSSMKLSYSDW